MKLLLPFISLFCIFNLAASAPIFLSGAVLDANNIPIPQAMVAVEGTKMGMYTDDRGQYTFEISPGQHTIVASAYGYKMYHTSVEIQANYPLNITLEAQSVDLLEVEISTNSKNQEFREGAFTVNAIGIQGQTSSLNNISTTLARSSGITIREDGGVGSDYDLSINGLSGNSVRYFIDGVPLSSIGTGVTLANLPVNIVDHVEVYKGVVPVHLGSDALGGAINIITTKDVTNYVDVSYGIGSFGTHKADFNAQYILPKSGVFIRPNIGFNYSKNNYLMKDVEVVDDDGRFYPTDAERFHDDYLSVLTQLTIGVNDKQWADVFTVSSSYFYADKELQTGSVQTWLYGMVTSKNKAFNLSTNYQKDKFFVSGLSTNMSLSRTWDEKEVVDTAYRQYQWDGSYNGDVSGNEMTGGAKSIRHTERPLTIGRVNFNYSLNSEHSFNFNYLSNHVTSDRYDDLDVDFEASKDVVSKQIVGLSYMQNILNDRLNSSVFVKEYFNHFEIGHEGLTSSDNYLGYGACSRLHIFDQLAIKASYEHSVRLPSAREYLGNGSTIAANYDLIPEHSENVNLGTFGSIDLAPHHRLYYETSFYYRKVQDYIRYQADQTEDISDGNGHYENVKDVTVKGLEGELRYSYQNSLQIVANMSYIDERNKSMYKDDGKIDASYNNHIPNRPWLYGNVEFSYRKRNVFGQNDNHLKFSYYYQYVQWFYLTWEQYAHVATKDKIPTQHANNVNLTYSFNSEKYNISLECNNIFDHTLYDNYRMQKPGRSYFLKFRLFIN